MKARGIAIVALLLLTLAGCGEDDAQAVEVVAGGGPGTSGTATEARLDGRLIAMVNGGDDVLRVLTMIDQQLMLWTVKNGQLAHTEVKNVFEAKYISQASVGPDNNIYVSIWNGDGGIFRIDADGSSRRVLGGREATGEATDGSAANKARVPQAGSVGFGTNGQLLYTEDLEVNFPQLRTVVGGKLKTLAGSSKTSQYTSERGFPDGTRATAVQLDSPFNNAIAAGGDGNIFVATGSSAIVVRPDGTARKVIGVKDYRRIPEARKPFADRGQAADLRLYLYETRSPRGSSSIPRSTPSMVADQAGDLYLVNRASGLDDLPESFNWTGDVSDAQRTLLQASKRQRTEQTEVLRIKPNGSAATVAAHADAVAVDANWIYLARQFDDPAGTGERVIIVKTEKR
ncbi:hypothetical protein [Actinoplanes sp. TFC3]|uniref:hypothetical protein n=1 Tax=Actinoplanes sp. TFC3 TaxID=1710355 RepID=UPI0012903F2A|nr:hypothetical protein [Actinoplanes sp. TFC3]